MPVIATTSQVSSAKKKPPNKPPGARETPINTLGAKETPIKHPGTREASTKPPGSRESPIKPPVAKEPPNKPPGARETPNKPPWARKTPTKPPGARETPTKPPEARETPTEPPGARETATKPPGARETPSKPPGASETLLHARSETLSCNPNKRERSLGDTSNKKSKMAQPLGSSKKTANLSKRGRGHPPGTLNKPKGANVSVLKPVSGRRLSDVENRHKVASTTPLGKTQFIF